MVAAKQQESDKTGVQSLLSKTPLLSLLGNRCPQVKYEMYYCAQSTWPFIEWCGDFHFYQQWTELTEVGGTRLLLWKNVSGHWLRSNWSSHCHYSPLKKIVHVLSCSVEPTLSDVMLSGDHYCKLPLIWKGQIGPYLKMRFDFLPTHYLCLPGMPHAGGYITPLLYNIYTIMVLSNIDHMRR